MTSEKITTHDLDESLLKAIKAGGINPNLLDNWYFGNPVNQNGKTEYISEANVPYAIDRWFLGWYTTAVLTGGGMHLCSNNTDNRSNGEIIQHIHVKRLETLEGMQATASALTGAGALYVVKGVVSEGIFDTYVGDIDRLSLARAAGVPGSFVVWGFDENIIAVKLELGSEQTLAHQDENGNWVLNEIPNYAEQVAICKQYNPTTGEYVGLTSSQIGAASNPNLLDNWYFADPINQRGQTEYVGTGYTIDRWQNANSAGGLVIEGGYIKFFSTIDGFSGACYLVQHLEHPERFMGKLLTASVLLLDGTLFEVSAIAAPNMHETVGIGEKGGLSIFSSGQSHLQLHIHCVDKFELDVVATKLELGSQQTLARQENGVWVLNDPPPNEQQELAKCQRYCYVPTYGGEENKSQIFLGVGLARSAESADINIPLPCAMRAVPSLTYNDLRLFSGINAFVVSSLNNYSQHKSLNNTNLMVIASSGGMTAGDVIELYTGDASPYLIISADL